MKLHMSHSQTPSGETSKEMMTAAHMMKHEAF